MIHAWFFDKNKFVLVKKAESLHKQDSAFLFRLAAQMLNKRMTNKMKLRKKYV